MLISCASPRTDVPSHRFRGAAHGREPLPAASPPGRLWETTRSPASRIVWLVISRARRGGPRRAALNQLLACSYLWPGDAESWAAWGRGVTLESPDACLREHQVRLAEGLRCSCPSSVSRFGFNGGRKVRKLTVWRRLKPDPRVMDAQVPVTRPDRAACGVAAHQDRRALPMPVRQLRERGVEHPDVIGSGVRAGVAARRGTPRCCRRRRASGGSRNCS
jgi:hypothetical protein